MMRPSGWSGLVLWICSASMPFGCWFPAHAASLFRVESVTRSKVAGQPAHNVSAKRVSQQVQHANRPHGASELGMQAGGLARATRPQFQAISVLGQNMM